MVEESSREVSIPTDRSSKDTKDRGAMMKPEENEEMLNSSAATAHRAIEARLNYFG